MSSDTCAATDCGCLAKTWLPTIDLSKEAIMRVFFPVSPRDILLVSASTLFYTLIFLTVLYFWWANRQFHFKKRQKDGSRLSSVVTSREAKEFSQQRKKREREMADDTSDSSSLSTIGEEDDLDVQSDSEVDLSDYETVEDDDGFETKRSLDVFAKQNMKFLASFPPKKRQAVKDLTAVVSSIEVFSYLSKEAFVQCLEFMTYVDLKEGDTLFDEENFDGSLYAVVDGQVRCEFEFTQTNTTLGAASIIEDDEEEDGPSISFVAGNGDVVTSLMSMLAGLVKQSQERNGQNYRISIVPHGIKVRAVGVAVSTRLVRVPPKCFQSMLDKFPGDVHRIAQTITARMQRVTIQTVVRCLGLQKEIIVRGNLRNKEEEENNPKLEALERLKVILKNYSPNLAPPAILEKVLQDTSLFAAATIMGPYHQMDDDVMKNVRTQLQNSSSIVSLPPAQTLIEVGDSHDFLYIVLQGSVIVGMPVMGTVSVLKQPNKRRSTLNPQTARQKIFPKQPVGAARRRHTSKLEIENAEEGAKTSSFNRFYEVESGEVVGQLRCFTGDASIIEVRNKSSSEPVLLYKIPKDTYNNTVSEHPSALTACLGGILDRLGSPITCILDWNVEWLHLQAGSDVVQKGDSCDSLYAVLNGRLRASIPGGFQPKTGKKSNDNMSAGSSTAAPPIPAPQKIDADVSGGSGRASFLYRAKEQLDRVRKNKPQVSKTPPPLSRRRMNTDGGAQEEYGRGAILGEVEILTGADWPSDIFASRHSELARVPVSVLNGIIRMYPRAGLHLAKVVASQIQKKNARKMKTKDLGGPPIHHVLAESSQKKGTQTPSDRPPSGTSDSRNILPSYGLPLATIAVIPLLEGDFDMDGFCKTLKDTLHYNIAPTALMTKAFARKELGDDVFRERNAMHALKLTRLCGDLEENARLVVYQGENSGAYTFWSRLCVQQADVCLLVVRAEQAPPPKRVEACLSWAFSALNVKIQLVVLQNSSKTHGEKDDEELEAVNAYETLSSSDALNDWSEQRYWIAGHHQVRVPFKKTDFKRLCRRVTERSVGLVLGGGGARGLAHVGVIKALMEAGITVDVVGGTSQGAYVGAIFAANPDDYDALVKSVRIMADSMSNVWEKLRDLTLPMVSFFSGYRFNRGIQKTLGLRRIQDLVCNFYCVSVDLRNNVEVVHTKGALWKYVRASMTLQSYLPPLSEDGTLLVDGGYMNVLPADIMKKQMGARTVIAVDVSQEVILDNFEYGSYLNGWWLLYNSWNPFVKTVKIPSMGDINERLAWVNGDVQKKRVREHISLFLQPPVSNYGVLEYDKMDEIVRIGYEYAKPRVENFVKKNPHLVSRGEM